MKIASDEDNYWGFASWVLNLKPWSFVSVCWSVNRHEMGVGIRWNTNGFMEFFLLPGRLTISYIDSRKDQMSPWYGWKKGDPYPADDNEEV